MTTYTNPLSRHQPIEVKPSPDGQTTQLFAPGNAGLTLVLLVQDKCTYCQDATEVHRLLNIPGCQIAHYDMTGLSTDKLTAIHNADYLYTADRRVFTEADANRRGVYRTPAFVLFDDSNPMAMLVGWVGDKEAPHSRLLLENRDRISEFFTKSLDEAEGITYATRGAPTVNDTDHGGSDIDDIEYQQSDVTGATYNVYWEKAAGTP
jgi:hypothetical protein